MAEGFTENVSIDEGVFNGVRTQLHFEGQELVVQKTFDAEPHLKHAEIARQSTQGMNWGEGRMVGHIPALHYAPIAAIKDRKEREKAILQYLRDNAALIMFDKFKP